MKALKLIYEIDVFSDNIAIIDVETESITEKGDIIPLMW